MASTFAVVRGGTVVNVVLATDEVAADNGWVPLPDTAGIGWAFDGAQFFEPPPVPAPVPQVVTMRQARLALLAAGQLSKVPRALSQLPSPAREAAEIEWEYAPEVRRHSPLVTGVGAAIGLDASALDALFIHAATL
jgi:hypothetical protein